MSAEDIIIGLIIAMFSVFGAVLFITSIYVALDHRDDLII